MARRCADFDAWGTDLVLRLTMGDFEDYFVPANDSATLCDMLLAANKHRWSEGDGGPFLVPDYAASGVLGGSDAWAGAPRTTLPAWGTTGNEVGGYGQVLRTQGAAVAWGRPFKLHVRVAGETLPSCPSLHWSCSD